MNGNAEDEFYDNVRPEDQPLPLKVGFGINVLQYFIVEVECWHEERHSPSITRRILLAATSYDEAVKDATDAAIATAEPGKQWIAFEFRKCSVCTLPMELPLEERKAA